MIDYDEVRAEIKRLEAGSTSWGNLEKLALLYLVDEHHSAEEFEVLHNRPRGYSYADGLTSEFSKAAAAVPFDDLLQVLNDHFEVVHAVFPKEYDIVMNRLREKF